MAKSAIVRIATTTALGALASFGLFFPAAALASDSPAKAPPSCHLTAQVTPDNDIRLASDDRPGGKEVGVPPAVQSAIHAMAVELLRKMELSPQWFRCGELYPAVFRISVAPGLYLYVADISLGSGVEYFVLVLSDPATGAVTKRPPLIHATSTQEFGWKDALLARPLVSFANFFGTRPQLVFEERVHNGTVYNAVVYHYFEIGTGVAMTRVLAVESRAVAIGPHQGRITRELEPLGADRLRLEAFLQPADQPGARLELGYVVLESPGPGVAFHVKERHARDKDSRSILVTYCGSDTPGDDRFLRDGYTFHY